MESKDKPPVSLRIRLKYPDVETFIQKYAANISQGGMFIQSRAPQPVGTALRFEVLLQDETQLLRGEGVVTWIKEYDAAHPMKVHGMGVRFTALTHASEGLLNRVLRFKRGAAVTGQSLSHEPPIEAAAPLISTERALKTASDEAPSTAAGRDQMSPWDLATSAEPLRRRKTTGTSARVPDGPSPFDHLLRQSDEEDRRLSTSGGSSGLHPLSTDNIHSDIISVSADPFESGIPRPDEPGAPQVVERADAPAPVVAAPADPAAAATLADAPAAPAGAAEPPPVAALGSASVPPAVLPSSEEQHRLAMQTLTTPPPLPTGGTAGVGGNGASAAIAAAEQLLLELLEQATLSEERVATTLREALSRPPHVGDPELDQLLAPVTLAAPTLEQAVSALRQIDAQPAAPRRPAPARADGFDPKLLLAAAHSARAAKQAAERSFDLSDHASDSIADELADDHDENRPPPFEQSAPDDLSAEPDVEAEEAPPPDEGWSGLHTGTELLDHDSSDVLRAMAQYGSQDAPHALDVPDDERTVATSAPLFADELFAEDPDPALPTPVGLRTPDDLDDTAVGAPPSEPELEPEPEPAEEEPGAALSPELLDALAELGNQEPPRAPAAGDRAAANVPSLETLADHVGSGEATPEDSPQVDDQDDGPTLPDSPGPLRPRKGGILRRIFRKKE